MLYNCFIHQLNALEGVPKISQKINEAHTCCKFMIFLWSLFPKMTSKAEHQYKQICVPNVSFHYQCDYLPLPIPCFYNCFSAFWCKNLSGRRLCWWWLNPSIFYSPAASVLWPRGIWNHIPSILSTQWWSWKTPF